MNREQLTPEAVIKALRGSRGIKLRAAEMLGVSRWTIDNYCQRYPEVQRAYLDEKERLLDVSESAFYDILESPSHDNHWNAVRFHLSTQGRDRGYGDSDVSLQRLKDQLGDVTDMNLDALNNDELKTLRALLLKAADAEAPQRPRPKAMHSTDMTAAKAVAHIRGLDRISAIVKFCKGDTRVTVKRAARQRKNAIKNQSDDQ